MNEQEREEMAALQALGLLDEKETHSLSAEAERDPALQAMVRGYASAAAQMAYDAPQMAPPAAVRRKIMEQLPKRRDKILPFTQWLPYALAACLMGLAIYQAKEIFTLDRQVGAEHANAVALQARNDMTELRLASLQTKDADYLSTKIMVAWDPERHDGVVSIQNMPAPPAGHDYQLWVLDPKAPAPISGGLVRMKAGSMSFAARPVRSTGPGFAISLEPYGGHSSPTTVLFAVAPGE